MSHYHLLSVFWTWYQKENREVAKNKQENEMHRSQATKSNYVGELETNDTAHDFSIQGTWQGDKQQESKREAKGPRGPAA